MKQGIEWHKTCKCKCRLDASFCNNKQRWNEDKCRCECKELIDKGIYDKGCVQNPSNWVVSVINFVILDNIQIMKTVSAEKG